MNANELRKCFPHFGYDESLDMIVSKSGNVTMCFEITLPDIYTMSARRFDELYVAFATGISLLGQGILIQKSDFFFEKRFSPVTDTDDYFTRKNNKHFKNRKFREHKCYIFISLMMFPLDKYASSDSSLISAFRRGITNKKLSTNVYQDFRSKVNTFTLSLKNSGLPIRQLDQKEIIGSGSEIGLSEKFLMFDLSENFITDIYFRDDNIEVGGKKIGVFSLKDMDAFPSVLNTYVGHPRYSVENLFPVGIFEPLGVKLDCDHAIHQYIYIENKFEVIAKIQSDIKNKDFFSNYSKENEISSEESAEYLSKFREGYFPVKYSCSIFHSAKTTEELEHNNSLITATIKNIGFTPYQAKADAPVFYWGSIPGNGQEIGNDNFVLTTNDVASALINYEGATSYPIVPEGVLFVSRDGTPFIHDMFETAFDQNIIDNRNFFLVGPSGSGKSFFTNYWVRNLHSQKAQVVIIDIGNSYKRTCENLGGVYINYDEDTRISINPFVLDEDLYKISAEKTMIIEEEKLDAITSIILTIWKKGDTTNTEKNVIKESIQHYYNHVTVIRLSGGTLDVGFNTYYEFIKTIFIPNKEKEFSLLDSGFDYKNLLLTLALYYKGGVYDYLLNSNNSRNNSLLHEPLIVFELDKIKDNPQIFPIVTIILIDLFINKMRVHEGQRKYLFLEEAWYALNDPKMSGFVKYLYRTVRKFYGTIGTITQDVEDLFSNEIIREVINKNSGLKIFFDQSRYQQKAQKLAETIGLSDIQKDVILTLNRNAKEGDKAKEVALCYGNEKIMVVKVEVSEEERLAFSTSQNESKQVNEYAKKLGSIENGIDRIVMDKNIKDSGYYSNKELYISEARV